VTTLSLSDQVHDLDWSSTPDGQSILAVGFAYRVEILCQQRMTYFDDGPSWGVIKRIEIERRVDASVLPGRHTKSYMSDSVNSHTQSAILSG